MSASVRRRAGARCTRMALLAALIVAATGTLADVAATGASDAPNAWTTSESSIPLADGSWLHAMIFRPARVETHERSPVILEVTPYNAGVADGSTGPDPEYPSSAKRIAPLTERGLFARGYTLVSVSMRGIGRSPGCVDFLGSRDRDAIRRAVEWAASQPWSNGSVGMYGFSYPGLATNIATAEAPRGLKAVVPMAAVSNLYSLFHRNRVATSTGPSVPAVIQSQSYTPPDPSYGPRALLEWALQRNIACIAAPSYQEQLQPDKQAEYWQSRDWTTGLQQSRIPTLQYNGFLDLSARPDGGLEYGDRRGPRHLWVGQWGHNIDPSSIGRFYDEVMTFFDRHVRGLPRQQADWEAYAEAVVQEGDGRWRAERRWPPGDTELVHVPVKPGFYLDLEDGGASGDWTFSQPFPYPAHLSGFVRTKVTVVTRAPGVTTTVQLYDVDPTGTGQLIASGAHRASGPAGLHAVDVNLYPQDWRIAEGHRLGILVSSSDPVRWSPTGRTGTVVQVGGGHITVPFLRYLRDTFIQGEPGVDVQTRPLFSLLGAGVDQNSVVSPLPSRQGHSDCWQASPDDTPGTCPN